MSIDIVSLIDMQEAIKRVACFTANLDFKGFTADELRMWAVYSQIIVLGEAANRVSNEFQKANDSIPWSQVISMRHRLVHGYDDILWDVVWRTAVEDLPKLKAAIDPLIPPEPEE